jgi:hypothetical protein
MLVATIVGIVLVPVFFYVIQSLAERVKPLKPLPGRGSDRGNPSRA